MKEYEKPVFKSVNSKPDIKPRAAAAVNAVAAINLAAGVNVVLWKNGVVTNGAAAVLVYLAVAAKTKMGVRK